MDSSKSLSGLYSGSKGKYRCNVCLDNTISRLSRHVDMEDHILTAHPRTALAWIFRNVTDDDEKLPMQGDDQDAGDDDDHSDDDDDLDAHTEATAPTSEDVPFLSLTRKALGRMNMSIINCDSLDDAHNIMKGISKMHRQHFITCFFPCMVKGSSSIAVEQYGRSFSYPTKGHIRDAIRHIIENAIQLRLCGTVADLKSKNMVEHPALSISHSIKNASGHPVHFCSCRLLCHYKYFDRSDFDKIVEDFRKEWMNIAGSNPHHISWMDRLRRSKHKDLIAMLDTRFSLDGKKLEYKDLPASNHEFIYNTSRHINDKQVKVTTLEELHEIMETLFYNYPTEIWEYMHIGGLNAYFGPEEYAYSFLNLVNKLTSDSDKDFYFAPLLQALKMCCIMLASSHNLHEKNFGAKMPFTQELQVAASEIENCIKGLENSTKKRHNCLLFRINAYQLKDVDILVFKSIRIIVFALHFLYLLASGKEINESILAAFDRTRLFLSKFSTEAIFKMQISSPRYKALSSTAKLPAYEDMCKIVGISFLITDAAKSSFSKKLKGELSKLNEMLKEDP